MNQGLGGRVPFSRGQVLAAPKKNANKTRFPENFSKKVLLKKIKIAPFLPWSAQRIGEIMGTEDEVVEAYVAEMLGAGAIDPKEVQMALKGFIGAVHAATFTRELWDLLLEAQASSSGLPEKFKDGFTREPTLSVEEALKKRVEAINQNILGAKEPPPLTHAKGAWGSSGQDQERRRDEPGRDRDRGREERDRTERPRDWEPPREPPRDRSRERDRDRDRDRDMGRDSDHRRYQDTQRRDRGRSRSPY